ncbi:hypothetical protein [Prescottella equi]|uniref:hypothetical protein n=1 Tax=Rhodococcus hoagii TaxID=43767 RepID=UPI00158506F1|nr:hypothetical protein [Prescottella equi]
MTELEELTDATQVRELIESRVGTWTLVRILGDPVFDASGRFVGRTVEEIPAYNARVTL